MTAMAARHSHSPARKHRRPHAGSRATLVTRKVLCEMTGITVQQLAVWEYEELIAPRRVGEIEGRAEPLYDRAALRRARVIRSLLEELGVNLPGIGIILNLLDRLEH